MNQAQEEQYQFYQTADAPGTFRATNPDHNFQCTHSADGLTITPRPDSSDLLNPEATPAWSVQYQAISLLLDAQHVPLESTAPSAFENQSSANRLPGCNEWFINSSEGLQHGFTVQQPQGNHPASLAVQIAVNATLTPTFNGTTKTVEFQDPAGRTLLGYRDLHVYDRTGRELSSAMALDTSGVTPSITLQADVHDALFPITIDPFTYMQEGVQQMPNDLSPGDGFGSSSAECGDYFVVGAPLQGNGAAYVYKRTPGTDDFVQVDKLEVPVGENPGTDDQFSSSLAFAEDEETGIKYLIVGAQQHNGCGSAFVYYLAGAVWIFLQRLQPADLTLGAYFACSIAVYGTMIAFGALAQDGKGAVYIFTLLLAVAAFALYQKVFDFLGSVGDDFGFDVDLFGLTLIVGTPGKDAQSGMTTYDRAGAALVFKAALIGGLFALGYAIFYNNNPGDDQNMGSSVLAWKNLIFIGIPGAAKVVVWSLVLGLWSQITFFTGPAGSLFGAYMFINNFGDLGISAPLALTTAVIVAGAIYMFLFNSITGTYPSTGEKTVPSNPDPGMNFGGSFVLIGRLLFAMAANYFFGQGAFFKFILTATLITITTFLLLYFTQQQIDDPTKQHLFGVFGDFDGDCISNFMEYLFGTHPTVFDRDPLAPFIRNGIFQILLPISLITLNAALFIEYAFSLNLATWFVLGTGLLAAILTSRVRHYGISRNVLLISMALVLALAINPRFFLRYRGEES